MANLIFLAPLLALALVGAGITRWRASEARATRWLEDRDLPTDGASVAVARRGLQLHGPAKWAGATAALVLLVVGLGGLPLVWQAAVLGSAVGVLVAERIRTHELSTDGAAVLLPRDPDDYVEPSTRFWWAAAAVVPVVATVVDLFDGGVDEGWIPPWFALVVLAVAFGLVRLATTWIAGQPQRLAERHLVVVDDACRATAAHAVVGCGLALAFLASGMATGWLARVPGEGTLQGFLELLAFAQLIAALGLWGGYGTDFRAVGRRQLPEATVAA